jgi:hypothetical protein
MTSPRVGDSSSQDLLGHSIGLSLRRMSKEDFPEVAIPGNGSKYSLTAGPVQPHIVQALEAIDFW